MHGRVFWATDANTLAFLVQEPQRSLLNALIHVDEERVPCLAGQCKVRYFKPHKLRLDNNSTQRWKLSIGDVELHSTNPPM